MRNPASCRLQPAVDLPDRPLSTQVPAEETIPFRPRDLHYYRLDATTIPTFQRETDEKICFAGPPQGLLGEWVFVHDVGSTTFAERYNFATLLPASVNGNGVVADLARNATCELATSTQFVGLVVCGQTDAAGKPQNVYVFHFGLDETFDGYWQSPTTLAQYPMKGFKTKSKSGFTR